MAKERGADGNEVRSNSNGLNDRLRRLLGLENLHDGGRERRDDVSESIAEGSRPVHGETLPAEGEGTAGLGDAPDGREWHHDFEAMPLAGGSVRGLGGGADLGAVGLAGGTADSAQFEGGGSAAALRTGGGPSAAAGGGGGGEHVKEGLSTEQSQQGSQLHAFNDDDEQKEGQEDQTIKGSVLQTDTTIDGRHLTIQSFTVEGDPNNYNADGAIVTLPGIGTFSLEQSGNYTFNPNPDWNGKVPEIHYTVTDGASLDASTLKLIVTPVDDSFTDADESASLKEDSSISGKLLMGTSSPDGPVSIQEFSIEGDSAIFKPGQTATISGVGHFTVDATGSYTFTPDQNWNGKVPPIHYIVTDGSSTDQSTLALKVTAINDKPVFTSACIYPAIEGGSARGGKLTAVDPDDPQSALIFTASSPKSLPDGFAIDP
jgi:CshA-type fibril repeat protein